MLLVAHARRSGSRLEGVLFSCYGHVVIDSYLQEFFKNWRDPLQKFRHVTHSSFGFIYFRGDVLLIVHVDTVL